MFTTNKVVAAPVRWSRQVLRWNALRAVVLNSGGANACTGPDGFADTHHTAERVATLLRLAPIDVAVCSTGLIGVRLDMAALMKGWIWLSRRLRLTAAPTPLGRSRPRTPGPRRRSQPGAASR